MHKPNLSGKRILVVEDEFILAANISQKSQRVGEWSSVRYPHWLPGMLSFRRVLRQMAAFSTSGSATIWSMDHLYFTSC